MPRVKLYDEDEVLEKAMDLFWKNGYHATSIQDLVSHLGIHRGSMYSSFGDKKQLYDLALNRYRKINTDRITNFLKQYPDPKIGFHQLFESALLDEICDQDRKGCFLVNSTTELANIDLEIKKLLQSNQAAFTSLFCDYLEKGKKLGYVKKSVDSSAVANLLFMLYNGFRVVGKIQDDKENVMKSIDTVLEVL